MNRKINYIVLFILCVITGCADRWEDTGIQLPDNGNVRVRLCSAEMPVIQTRNADEVNAYSQIESVNLFVFKKGETLVHKKVFQFFEQATAEVSLFLTKGEYDMVAVCNWHNPEALYDQVQDWEQLKKVELHLQNPDDAFMGKYVMYSNTPVTIPTANNQDVVLWVDRVASRHEFTIDFLPDTPSDQFQLTEAWIHNIPRGSWLVPQVDKEPKDYVESARADWVYQDLDDNMKSRYFEQERLTLELLKQPADSTDTKWTVGGTFSLLENRRGGLPVEKAANGYEYSEHYWEGSQSLAEAGESALAQLSALRQYYKRYYAQNEPLEKDSQRKKFEFATYFAIKGFYKNNMGTSEVTYYIYLGEDSYKDYNVKRNHRYQTLITIRTINSVDTRVEAVSMEEARLAVPDEILDAHCNVVKGVFFSPDPWEIWVEDPDKTPWLELSGTPKYSHVQIGGAGVQNQETQPTYRMTGNGGVLRNIYIHTDEYIPDLKDPMMNSRMLTRSGRIGFRRKGSQDVKYVTIKQYPAQLAVLHIKYDVHTMKEVRDTFYIERKLEKKYMPWGLESYWSFITDDLIASGLWDGLSNTRKLYQVALFGDKWGVKPGYPAENYPDGIPQDCALGYVVNKNRDRDGNGKVDYDEIMWYFPARKEMQYLYKAVQQNLVTFDGANSIFHSSSPSSADAGGITVGFSYYVKMSNGKYGIGQRNRKYNVLSMRRKHNEWSGPKADTGNFTLTVETGWTDEEVIMPK